MDHIVLQSSPKHIYSLNTKFLMKHTVLQYVPNRPNFIKQWPLTLQSVLVTGAKSHKWILNKILLKTDKIKIIPFCNKISVYYITKHSFLQHTFTLKKAVKMYEWDSTSMLSASNVEIPPLKMAGPMSVIVSSTLTDRGPVRDRKARHIWAA
jgi:hypothetical protein